MCMRISLYVHEWVAKEGILSFGILDQHQSV